MPRIRPADLYKLGLPCCAVAGTVAVVAGSMQSAHPSYFGAVLTYSRILDISIGLGLLGLSLIAISLTARFITGTIDVIPVIITRSIGYETRRATYNDLTWIYDYAVTYFGETISPLDRMRKWYGKNGEVFWLISRVKSGGAKKQEQLSGYFCILPLNKRGRQLLEENQIDGSSMTTDYLAPRHTRPRAVYIGAIAASDRKARAHGLEAIQRYMTKPKFEEVRRLYAKAATDDGLRLLRKNHFKPMPNAKGEVGDLYYRDVPPG
jgi:hypothetical protein